jgi:hypothetical protein
MTQASRQLQLVGSRNGRISCHALQSGAWVARRPDRAIIQAKGTEPVQPDGAQLKTSNINKGKKGFAVTPDKYELIRSAILASVPRTGGGVTFKELVASVATRVPTELFPKKGSVSWYTKVVQLDLEARGQLQRKLGQTPQRISRTK